MISLIVSGAALIFVEVKKRTTFARLEHNLGERDFDACLALLDQPITKALYSEYNRLYMSLNAYLAPRRQREFHPRDRADAAPCA